MYSMLPPDQQDRVFRKPPVGCRLIVVATNVAETSITIPNMRYVVDTGRVKQRVFKGKDMASFEVQWVSKASARQRAGRAGRTGPGHVYRLYSSQVYLDYFPEFSEPEMSRVPIESVYLTLSTLGIAEVAKFPFPSPPPLRSLENAKSLLAILGLVNADGEKPTPLGQRVSAVPASPRLGLMLVLGQQWGVLPHATGLVAALSVGDPFLREARTASVQPNEDDKHDSSLGGADEDTKRRPQAAVAEPAEPQRKGPSAGAINQAINRFANAKSDALTYLAVLGAYEFELATAAGSPDEVGADRRRELAAATFCEKYCLHPKLMKEMSALRSQLCRDFGVDASVLLQPPSASEEVHLLKAICAGLIDHVARVKSSAGGDRGFVHPVRGAIYAPCDGSDDADEIHLHRMSALHASRTEAQVQFVAYFEMSEGRSRFGSAPASKVLRINTDVEPSWLSSLAFISGDQSPICRLSEPLDEPKPYYDVGRDSVECYVRPFFGVGQVGWPLPPMRSPMATAAKTSAARTARYGAFAAALLQGSVLPGLKPFVRLWSAEPLLLTRSGAMADRKCAAVLVALSSARVCSKAELLAKLAKSPGFLIVALEGWVQQPSSKLQLRAAWASVPK